MSLPPRWELHLPCHVAVKDRIYIRSRFVKFAMDEALAVDSRSFGIDELPSFNAAGYDVLNMTEQRNLRATRKRWSILPKV